MISSLVLASTTNPSINIGKYVTGIILALAICLIAYLAVMAVYFWLRRKKPNSKYLIEVIFVVFAMALSVGFKLAVLPFLNVETGNDDTTNSLELGDYVAYSLSSIYSMIGGLSFEGLSLGGGDIGNAIVQCTYFGSSILSGLIVLSVITAKASYEIFSLVMIKVLKNKRAVYVFNGITEDALLLAQDIAAHHQEECDIAKTRKKDGKKIDKAYKPRKALIIFAGDNIPTFSRSDNLCREVMSNSFYYCSMMSGKGTEKSLITRLGLRRNNLPTLTYQQKNITKIEPSEFKTENEQTKRAPIVKNKRKESLTRVEEFYFSLDENFKPTQEKNTTDAFYEIDNIINDFFYSKNKAKLLSKETVEFLTSKKLSEFDDNDFYKLIYLFAYDKKWTITKQHILTDGDANYEYFTLQTKERIDKVLSYLSSLPTSRFFTRKELSKLCRINEKNQKEDLYEIVEPFGQTLSDLVNKLCSKQFVKDLRKKASELLHSVIQVSTVNESYLASLSLLDERYQNVGASEIWKHLQPTDEKGYNALILGFGTNGQNALHALYFGGSHIGDDSRLTGFFADVYDKNMDDIKGIFAKNHPLYRCYSFKKNDKNVSLNNDEIKLIYPHANETSICEDVSLPELVFHTQSCTGAEFIEFIDNTTGNTSQRSKYAIIVISFGSDSLNIKVANMLIDDIRREYHLSNSNKTDFRQCIAVNIRDKNNVKKLNWGPKDCESKTIKNLLVFSYGAKEDIYKFDNIIDCFSQYEYHTNYSSMAKNIDVNNDTNSGSMTKKVLEMLDDLCKNYPVEVKKEFSSTDEKEKAVLPALFENIYNQRAQSDVAPLDAFKHNLKFCYLANFTKESNRITDVYSRTMRRAIKHICTANIENETLDSSYVAEGTFVLSLENLNKLLILEHDRWSRFMIANGWIHSNTKIPEFKLHNELLPAYDLKKSSYAYDLINIIPQYYKVYNHCHILYKYLISNCQSRESIEKEIVSYLTYCFSVNKELRYERDNHEGLNKIIDSIIKKYSVIWNRRGEKPLDVSPIVIKFDNSSKNEAILVNLHYDIYSQKEVLYPISKNAVYQMANDKAKLYSSYGGADDLAGVASSLFGIVSALKDYYGDTKKTNTLNNIIVLITGGEEYGAKGITKLLQSDEPWLERFNGEKYVVKECITVDLNDRVGTYSNRGSEVRAISNPFGDNITKNIAKEYSEKYGELDYDDPKNNIKYFRITAKTEAEANEKEKYVKELILTRLNEGKDSKETAIFKNTIEIAKAFNNFNESSLVERYENACQSVGITAKLSLTDVACDANVIKTKYPNIPIIVIGSGAINAHGAKEYVYIDDLEKNAEIIKKMIIDNNKQEQSK